MNHFAGTRRNLCDPSSVVRAPTTWSIDSSFSSTAIRSGIRSFGYDMSASVHTTISPRASCDPIRRTVPDPPLRWNARTRMCGKRGSASLSLARV
jgi:hypothetical protein